MEIKDIEKQALNKVICAVLNQSIRKDHKYIFPTPFTLQLDLNEMMALSGLSLKI